MHLVQPTQALPDLATSSGEQSEEGLGSTVFKQTRSARRAGNTSVLVTSRARPGGFSHAVLHTGACREVKQLIPEWLALTQVYGGWECSPDVQENQTEPDFH